MKVVGEVITLSDLKPGDKARVVHVGVSGSARKRYMEMGLVRGEVVEVLRVAPLGDPVEVEVKGYKLSLRRAEAKQVTVEKLEELEKAPKALDEVKLAGGDA